MRKRHRHRPWASLGPQEALGASVRAVRVLLGFLYTRTHKGHSAAQGAPEWVGCWAFAYWELRTYRHNSVEREQQAVEQAVQAAQVEIDMFEV